MAGSIRQRGKRPWEVRAFAGKDSATGRKQYVTKTDVSQPVAAGLLPPVAATGARRGKMCALRWKHVDFDRRRLTIARGIVEAGGQLVEKDTKSHQSGR